MHCLKNVIFAQPIIIMMSNELSILIVEDDFSFALELEMLVEKIGYRVHAKVDNSAEALEIMLTDPPDLVLMDIDIRGRLTGLEVAEKLAHLDIPVLFITSFRDQATYERSQRAGGVGYVVKPVESYTLRTTINSVIRSLKHESAGMENEKDSFLNKEFLYFKRRNVYEKIAIDKITYIKANDNYTRVFGLEEEFHSTLRMSELMEILPERDFFQIHRSFIVNMNHVSRVESLGTHLWVKGVMLPVSRRNKKELFMRVNLRK
ncbi:MAG: LytR/AlgR family response regulator transcription factor [Saprospiraceae bacterium]